MLTNIHVRIDDPIWMEAFQNQFQDFVISYKDLVFKFPMSRVIHLIKMDMLQNYDEMIEATKKNEEGSGTLRCQKGKRK